jgi:roadblock/LC7 domain-containing protein
MVFERSAIANRGVEHLFPMVRERICAAVEEFDSTDEVQAAVRGLLTTRHDEPAMLAVPILVHAAEAGSAEPAVPISSIHLLWWTAAHVFDDFIDGGVTEYAGGLSSGEALMAAVVCGAALPASIAARDFPSTVLPAMISDFSSAWIMSNDGQIRDINGVAGRTDSDGVLVAYRNKNGAAYGAVCAMSARLAGCSAERAARWRRFGEALGFLGQFRNDQEDLVSGRDEDLRNGTVTYLLSHLLDSTRDADRRRRLIELTALARKSREARSEVKAAMLTPVIVRGYLRQVDVLRRQAHQALDVVGIEPRLAEPIRTFIDDAAAPVPEFIPQAGGEPIVA